MIKVIILTLMLTLTTACVDMAYLSSNRATAELIIEIGTTQYISAENDPTKRVKRAQDLKDKINQFSNVLEGNPTMSLSDMETVFRESINWVELSVADQVLANALIKNVKLQLQSKVEDKSVPEDYAIAVKYLFKVILNVTSLYGI